jgi:NADPH-dependent glutamate synthase beta subunit-like oxidoreductase
MKNKKTGLAREETHETNDKRTDVGGAAVRGGGRLLKAYAHGRDGTVSGGYQRE